MARLIKGSITLVRGIRDGHARDGSKGGLLALAGLALFEGAWVLIALIAS